MSLFENSDLVQHASWELLKPHHLKDRLFALSNSIKLEAARDALAHDRADYINELIKLNKMRRFSLEEAERFEKEKTSFDFVIVQPFVIVQYDLQQ